MGPKVSPMLVSPWVLGESRGFTLLSLQKVTWTGAHSMQHFCVHSGHPGKHHKDHAASARRP